MLGASVPTFDDAKEKLAPSLVVRRTWSRHPEQPRCAATHQCRSSIAVTDDAPETSSSVRRAGAGVTSDEWLGAVELATDALGCEEAVDDRLTDVGEAPEIAFPPSSVDHGRATPSPMPTTASTASDAVIAWCRRRRRAAPECTCSRGTS